ncbi:hypothetical protein MBEHAL_0389 [Halarchaeum acidiphilum MH1-52-1]|uniref:Uncharacterized protein n=2 Tax=Halarchaeum acidiphilum TaxID=489138 RepID=U3A1U7_9EURY|nr:hypothetical protein [Halarchaeum acidiphilum]GAD51629.1 hypothetical protein MBEHAL_0389 [Halarchaeum acidiphilum MH1-52-1]
MRSGSVAVARRRRRARRAPRSPAARAVLETATRRPGYRPRDIVAAASAIDLLDARTAVRRDGLPDREPGGTRAVLVGDYLHSLAFEALVDTDTDVAKALVDAVTSGLLDLYGREATAETAGDFDAVSPARRGVFAVADAVVDALDSTGEGGPGPGPEPSGR